jgi:hypothetical protein
MIALPVAAGFVVLGATVLVARSLRELVRGTWSWVPGRRPSPEVLAPPANDKDSHAA